MSPQQLWRGAVLTLTISLLAWAPALPQARRGGAAPGRGAPQVRRREPRVSPAAPMAAAMAEVLVQAGHSSPASIVVFSPDGNLMASGGHEQLVFVWDVRTARLLRTFGGFTSNISYLEFSPDGKTLAAAEHRRDSKRVWNLLTGKLILEDDGLNGFQAFSPGGMVMATSQENESTGVTRSSLRDTQSGRVIRRLAGEFVAFSPDDGSTVAVRNSGQIMVEDTVSGTRRLTLKGEFAGFSPDGSKIIVQNRDVIESWAINSGEQVGEADGYFQQQSPDGRIIVSSLSTTQTGRENHNLALWDAGKNLPICRLATALRGPANADYPADTIFFNPHRESLVTTMYVRGQLVTKLWDAKKCNVLGEFKDEKFVGFSRDGRRLLLLSGEMIVGGTATGQLTQITLRDATTGDLLDRLPAETEDGSLRAEFVATDTGETLLITESIMAAESGAMRSRVALRDAETLNLIAALDGDAPEYGVAHSGKFVALNEGVDIKLWETTSGRFGHILHGQAALMAWASFSADGNSLLSVLGGSAEKPGVIWGLKSGTPRSLEPVKLENGFKLEKVSADFNLDGSVVAGSYYAARYEEGKVTASESGTAFWDSQSGRVTRTSKEERFNRFILPNDAQYVTSPEMMSGEGAEQERRPYGTRFRDTKTGNVIHTLDGELFAGATPAGEIVATVRVNRQGSGVTCRASLWGAGGKTLIRRFEGACALAFSHNGQRLVVESATPGVYELWDARGTRRAAILRMPPRRATLRRSDLQEDDDTLAFGPGDAYVIASTWGGLAWWRTSDGTLVHGEWPEAGFNRPNVVAYNGELIAVTTVSGNRFNHLDVLRVSNGTHLLKDSPDDFVRAVGFSGDDSRIIVQGYYDAYVLDARSGRTLRTFLPPSGGFADVKVGPGGKLVTENADGTFGVWTPNFERELVRIIYLDDDWLVVTPEGFFDGSPGAYRRLAWRFSQNTFDTLPVEAFFNDFYLPGLLTDVYAAAVPAPPRNLAQVDRRMPELKFLSVGAAREESGTAPQEGARLAVSVAEPAVRVVLEVKESPATRERPSGGARDVRLFRNGLLVKSWKGDVTGGAAKGCTVNGRGSAICETTIPVVAGENLLTAYGFNAQNVKSEDANHTLVGDRSLARKGTLYVLAVGVNEYENSNYDLNFAVADAVAFSDELRRQQAEKLSPQARRYSRVEIVPLLDAQATKANILKALARLSGEDTSPLPDDDPLVRLRRSQPEDAVIIYFAGHGTAVAGSEEGGAEQGRFYLIPHDMGYRGPRVKFGGESLSLVKRHGISDRELESAFEKIDAGLLLLLIDACYSGEVLASEEWRRGPMNSRGLAQLAYEKGMYVLTASQGYESAKESSRLGHGLLTYALVEEGLKKEMADKQPEFGQIELREWLNYAAGRVPELQADKEAKCRAELECPPQRREDLMRQWREQRVGQQPRVFYRREPEAAPFVVGAAGIRREAVR